MAFHLISAVSLSEQRNQLYETLRDVNAVNYTTYPIEIPSSKMFFLKKIHLNPKRAVSEQFKES
jgi:hypothetical protein